eukprot:542852_1
MQELQTLRNNYEKKNASLTKDVKRLIIQLEKQTKSFKSNSVTQSIAFADVCGLDESDAIQKLRDENAQLSQELIRKSQSLVNALRALAEFHQNPHNITKSITSNLSHAQQYNHNPNENGYDPNHAAADGAALASYVDVSNQLKAAMEHNLMEKEQQSETPTTATPVVFGAQYGINDVPPSTTSTKLKFNRFKSKMGNKMKQQITKLQQNMVKDQVQRMKGSEDETLNELNARSAIKESEKILITKTKQQLNSQCAELQGLANELSSTIEGKEVILDSLRFANTYLGKRVIALELLMKMDPGTEIKNQDELIRDALHICYAEELEYEKEKQEEEVKTEEIDVRNDATQKEQNDAKTEEVVEANNTSTNKQEEVEVNADDKVELDVISAGGDLNEESEENTINEDSNTNEKDQIEESDANEEDNDNNDNEDE